MELISVIVPVYNVEKYLDRCVSSIRNQTYTALEIILVDDGSPDDCPRLCEELAKADSRIRVVHKRNGGLGFARNSGLDVATGAYVTFIDSDDWIAPNHIENLYCAAVRADADAVIGSHTIARADGSMEPRPIEMEEKQYTAQAITEELLLPLIGPHVSFPRDVQINSSSCMNLYRMSVIREHNLRFLSEKYAVGEDLYFNIDFFYRARQIVAINEFGYFYFENEASISRKYDPHRFDRTLNCYAEVQKRITQYDLQNRAVFRAERSFLMKVRVAIRHVVFADMPRKEKLARIRDMLHHETVVTVLNAYPIDTYGSAIRLLSRLMRKKNAFGVYYLMKIREIMKNQSMLKSLSRKLGLGR